MLLIRVSNISRVRRRLKLRGTEVGGAVKEEGTFVDEEEFELGAVAVVVNDVDVVVENNEESEIIMTYCLVSAGNNFLTELAWLVVVLESTEGEERRIIKMTNNLNNDIFFNDNNNNEWYKKDTVVEIQQKNTAYS